VITLTNDGGYAVELGSPAAKLAFIDSGGTRHEQNLP